jgi:hypothetical protein
MSRSMRRSPASYAASDSESSCEFPSRCRTAASSSAQIPTGDLDIAVVPQLTVTHFPLCDQFAPGPMQIVGFEATLRRRRLVEQDLEDASRNPNDPLILAHADAERDAASI